MQDAMRKEDATRARLFRLQRLIEAVCGVYSRVGNRLKRDRSYVSRVARGKRRSEKVERALISEFDRIERDHLK